MASTGIQEDFVQRVSSAVCESMRNEHVKDYDTIYSRHDTVMSWPILIVNSNLQFSLHIWLSYNTELKTFVKFIYFDSFAIVII